MKRLALILVLVTSAFAQQPVMVERSRFAATWNDIEHTVDDFNTTRKELGDSIDLYPPWRVASAPKQQRRRELYDEVARQAEHMAKRYRELSELER